MAFRVKNFSKSLCDNTLKNRMKQHFQYVAQKLHYDKIQMPLQLILLNILTQTDPTKVLWISYIRNLLYSKPDQVNENLDLVIMYVMHERDIRNYELFMK